MEQSSGVRGYLKLAFAVSVLAGSAWTGPAGALPLRTRCFQFFMGERDTLRMTKEERYLHELRKRRPNYKPEMRDYRSRPENGDLITDIAYCWYPDNIWHDAAKHYYGRVMDVMFDRNHASLPDRMSVSTPSEGQGVANEKSKGASGTWDDVKDAYDPPASQGHHHSSSDSAPAKSGGGFGSFLGGGTDGDSSDGGDGGGD